MSKSKIIKGMNIHFSRQAIADEIKVTVIPILNKLVADFADLALITKQAHWNIRGANFIAVHEMLDDFRDALLEHQDTFAERVVQLGGTAMGTLQEIAGNSSLTPYPTDIYRVEEHLTALADRYAQIANTVREIAAGENGEYVAEVLNPASQDLDKFLWFLEAHLDD